MQAENDDDLDGGQRSSEVKWGKLCDMATICDPSHQNRAVVGRMHFKILLHLYGKKQRK